ncbi:MAG TPA: energy-coupling factor ABC transporter permease [Thermoanaerobaculaceae bacterium]|nr:energy-coupling factor ABC transporter permease [Thermoanaerobaculaceae bacterium]HRS16943.1 energy-coupling factor ABC transporter permease [Thermoanaerobaculaceae bacterium]
MHIPDGFLSLQTAAAAAAVSAVTVGVCVRRLRRTLQPRQVPLLGLTATFVFVAQMLNFPVAGGTSGHLLGATLVAVLLGPAAAVLVITTVLVVQCLVFADGGLLALGANVLNMAVIGGLAGGGLHLLVRRFGSGLRGTVTAAAFASWCSVVLAATACAIQLALSGAAPARLVLPAMAGVHAVIGLGEAVITALVLVSIGTTRPELVGGVETPTSRRPALAPRGLLVVLALVALAVPFGSSLPDGLQWVVGQLGLEHRAVVTAGAPLADYLVPGLDSSLLATALAGLAGAGLMLGVSCLLGRLLVPGKRARAEG